MTPGKCYIHQKSESSGFVCQIFNNSKNTRLQQDAGSQASRTVVISFMFLTNREKGRKNKDFTRKFWHFESFTKLITEMIAILWQQIIWVARPLSSKFPYYLINLEDGIVCSSKDNWFTVSIHRILSSRTTENSSALYTEPKWPLLITIDLLYKIISNLATESPNQIRKKNLLSHPQWCHIKEFTLVTIVLE